MVKEMTTKVVISNATLYLGDAFEILPTLSGFDSVITDPPYGLGKESFNGRGKARARKERLQFSKVWDWDKKPDLQPILDLKLPTIVWGGNYFTDQLPPMKTWLVWTKGGSMKNRTFSEFEMAWCSYRAVPRYFEYTPLADGKKVHPTQKPLELMCFCVDHLPKNCETILDPFMGSGTTGAAALKRGKSFIGIEKDPEYFEMACERIEKIAAQPDIFHDAKETKQQDESWLIQ